MWLTPSYQSSAQAIVFARNWFSRGTGTYADRAGTSGNSENRFPLPPGALAGFLSAAEFSGDGFADEVEPGLVGPPGGVDPVKQWLVQRQGNAKRPDRLAAGLLLFRGIGFDQIRT